MKFVSTNDLLISDGTSSNLVGVDSFLHFCGSEPKRADLGFFDFLLAWKESILVFCWPHKPHTERMSTVFTIHVSCICKSACLSETSKKSKEKRLASFRKALHGFEPWFQESESCVLTAAL